MEADTRPTYWNYTDNEAIHIDPTAIEFQPTGSFYKDIQNYCDLISVALHPCFKEPSTVTFSLSLVERKESGTRIISKRATSET